MTLSHRIAVALAALTFAAAPARAQLLDTKSLGSEAVKHMMDAAEAEAKKNGWKVSISIVDVAGELLMFQRLDDAPLSTIAVSQGKARTAARFRRPTKALDSALTAGRTALLAFEGLVPVEGGVPVIANGKVIGAVGVSGATSQQDAQVAQAGASALKP